MPDPTPTRRELLRTSAALGVAGIGVSLTGAAAAKGSDNKLSPGMPFGVLYANGHRYRTNVVRKSDEQFDPDDILYFVHGGDPDQGGDGPLQPGVSDSAPGDQDYNGGKWTHYSAEVVDKTTYEQSFKPLTSEKEVRAAEDAGVVEITKGRPFDSAPPNFFLCPLNGRA